MNPKSDLYEYEPFLYRKGLELSDKFYNSKEFRAIEDEIANHNKALAEINISLNNQIAIFQKYINELKIKANKETRVHKDAIQELKHLEISKAKDKHVRERLYEYKETLRLEIKRDIVD
jgi:hypothetical protein